MILDSEKLNTQYNQNSVLINNALDCLGGFGMPPPNIPPWLRACYIPIPTRPHHYAGVAPKCLRFGGPLAVIVRFTKLLT